jgi:heme A synthase
MHLARYAVATALATFVLLVAGGLVSTTESGLACPDWPLCEGKYIPPMVDGKQFEHTHRLVASFVGVMTFGLGALLFKHRRRDRLLKGLGALAAVLVTVQGLLGALTVKLKLPVWVSTTHLATAMAFFTLIVSLAMIIPQRARPSQPGPAPALRPWVLAALGLTYVQIVLGAAMRHTRSGLVCGYDVPLCLGQLWPLDGHVGIQLHLLHRLFGVIAGAAILAVAVRLGRLGNEERSRGPRRLGWALALGVLAQIALGVATILTSRDLVTMTAHSSLGAALLAGLVVLLWWTSPVPAARLQPTPEAAAGSSALEVA